MSNLFQSRFQGLVSDVVNKIAEYLVMEHPETLYGPMKYAMSSGGKRLRPLLVLTACEAVGGKTSDALNAAAALELVHNFTLVHDDIMDDDDIRRGRETVHKKWDENVAILSGDALLVVAYQALAESGTDRLGKVLNVFSQGILKVCEGQTLDKEFESRDQVSLEEYFEMIDKKTAELFAVSCAIGGMMGNGSEEQVRSLDRFGRKLGRAFQIQDDLLDVLSDQDVLGKDIGSDLEENKKTFLVTHALQHAGENDKQALITILQKGEINARDVENVITIFKSSGTLDAAKQEIDACIRDAGTALESLPDSEARAMLYSLLEMIEKRNS